MTLTGLRDAGSPDADSKGMPVVPPKPVRSALRRRLVLLFKLCVAGGAFALLLSRQSWSELKAAITRLTPGALLIASLLAVACLAVGTLRWRLLLRAYGAARMPRFMSLLRVYFVGTFYNTYVPGALGGDLLRGVVTRRAFESGGVTAGITIVLVERALGLLGVLALFSFAARFNADDELRRRFLPYCALGVIAIAAVILAVALGRRLQSVAPRRLAPTLAALPALSHVAPFVGACLLSLVTQLLVALSGHVLLTSVYTDARLFDSLLATPAAAGAAFLPISVAGAGPRDLVLVALYTTMGVPRAAAAAVALALLACTLFVAGIGGVWQFLAPLTVDDVDQRPE